MPLKSTLHADQSRRIVETLNSAMAAGLYGKIPDFLIEEARKNPNLDWHDSIKHVLTTRSITVGNRIYSTRLVAVSLFGNLGRAFAPVKTAHAILKEALKKSILAKEEGLIFLDAPIPRGTVQLMDFEDMYNLSERLFERGVREGHAPVLEARLIENEMERVDAAIMVGLIYWRSEKEIPKLLTDNEAQMQLANIVREHVFFDRANPSNPRPYVHALPLKPFFDATRDSSRWIAQQHIARLVARHQGVPIAAQFSVSSSEELIDTYQIEVRLQDAGGASDYILRLQLDSLLDGNTADYIELLRKELSSRGITKFPTMYAKEVSFATSTETETPACMASPLH